MSETEHTKGSIPQLFQDKKALCYILDPAIKNFDKSKLRFGFLAYRHEQDDRRPEWNVSLQGELHFMALVASIDKLRNSIEHDQNRWVELEDELKKLSEAEAVAAVEATREKPEYEANAVSVEEGAIRLVMDGVERDIILNTFQIQHFSDLMQQIILTALSEVGEDVTAGLILSLQAIIFGQIKQSNLMMIAEHKRDMIEHDLWGNFETVLNWLSSPGVLAKFHRMSKEDKGESLEQFMREELVHHGGGG